MVKALLVFICLCGSFAWAGSNQSLIYQGRITRPDGTLISSGTVNFTLSIRSPSPQNCVLFTESHSVDMTGSQGVFSLEIGTGTRTDSGLHAFRKVFVNGETLTGLTCGNGDNSYLSAATDDRNLVLSFTDGGTTISFAAVPIKSVPFAMQAKELDGWGIGNLVKVSSIGSPTTFTTAEMEIAKNMTGLTCTTNQILKWNGSAWSCASDDSGGSAGDAGYGTKGLISFDSNASTSGVQVSAGVASLNTGTGPNQIVKLDGAAKLPALDGSALTNLSAAQISTGNLSTSGNITTTGVGGISSAGTVVVNSAMASTSTASGALTVVGGTGISGALNVGSNIVTSGNLTTGAGTAATAGANQSSPSLFLRSNYWTGSVSAVDQWSIQNILGTGANPKSTLAFDHSGSTGTASYAFLNGRMGIGTADPNTKLHVVGNSRFDGAMVIDNEVSAGTTLLELNQNNIQSHGPAEIRFSANRNYTHPQVGGILGLISFVSGTTWHRGAQIAAVANQNFDGTSAGTELVFYTTPDNTSTTVERMKIEANGSVGIGTSAPVAKLDVSGDLRVQNGQAYNPIQTSSASSPLTFNAAMGNNLRWNAGSLMNPIVNIYNMKPGGSYLLVVQGTGTGPVTVNCYSDAGTTALPNSFLPANGNRLAGPLNKTIYDILSDGENCMISWSSGY